MKKYAKLEMVVFSGENKGGFYLQRLSVFYKQA